MKLHVIYRLCDATESVNGLPRPLQMTKKQVIGCCFRSLFESLQVLGTSWSMTIVADNVSQETSDFIRDYTNGRAFLVDQSEQAKTSNSIPPFPVQINTEDKEASLELPVISYINFNPPLRNQGSLLKAYEVADGIESTDEETWVYFCEDDYLHDKSSFIPRLLDFIALAKAKAFALPVFYHPTDYPDQYTRLLSRNYLFQALTGYFREVSSTTGTYLCSLSTYRQFASWIKECTVDDGKFSTIFKKKALCFSPLPGSATHMHEGVMSTYVDWGKAIYGQ